MTRHSHTVALLACTAALLALAICVEVQRDRLYAESAVEDDGLLYIQSPNVMRKAALSYDAPTSARPTALAPFSSPSPIRVAPDARTWP